MLSAPLMAALLSCSTQGSSSEAPIAQALLRTQALLRASQQAWSEDERVTLRADLARSTAPVLLCLVEALADPTRVEGLSSESTHYTVCGNALTLLEDMTHVRIDALGRDWIGARTHDHRLAAPSFANIEGPWRAWLALRADVPVSAWFWGLSYADLAPITRLLSRAPAQWSEPDIEHANRLGSRAYPFLLAKLLDDECSAEARVADRAHELLRRITGKDVGKPVRHELLSYPPGDPLREQSIHLNRAALELVHARWIALLTR